jgi:hypothetical protein
MLMAKPIFVPTATPVENVVEGERPFDWKLLAERPLFRFCNLSLRGGCYQLFLTRTDGITLFSDRFEGTMRVEIGRGDTTVSGDLYKIRRFDDLVIAPAEKIFAAPQPIIPIKPRSKYFSYLRVVGISSGPVLTQFAQFAKILPPVFNLCTISLTVEEFRYTHPTAGQANGSFPQTPTRTLLFVLSKAAVPAGFPGPAFEGDVFENGVRLPLKVSLYWVSDFFRRARLELENVTGVAIPGSVGADSFQSTYAKAGWDVTVVNGNANIAIPGGVSPSWSEAELHAFMVANRNPAVNLDREWHAYHVSVPLDFTPNAGIFGIMFDQLADEREGACNFIQNFTGNFNDNRSRLRSAIHEIGHAFNQLHPPTEGLANDNSIMTQSGGVRTVIQSAGGTYPNDINFAFNAHNTHHLIHAPDVVVRPGGEDFMFGHDANFAPEAQDDARDRGVTLRVAASDGRLKLGQPLVVNVELVNGGATPVLVPAILGTKLHNVSIVVRTAGREERRIRSFVLICHEELSRDLAPGKSITWEEVVYWDRNGVVFPDPGRYSVSVEARWFVGGQPLAAEATVDVWVDYPLTEKENAVAAALLDDEVGKYVALGGNAVHLRHAVARIAEAKKAEPQHPAVRRIAQIDERARAIKNKRSAAKKRRK